MSLFSMPDAWTQPLERLLGVTKDCALGHPAVHALHGLGFVLQNFTLAFHISAHDPDVAAPAEQRWHLRDDRLAGS